LWSACKPEDIYKKRYSGLYCVGCEQFYTTKELVDGKCPEHQTVPEAVEEENYFFRLSNYQKQLEKLIVSDKLKIVPESRKNEALSFIRMGLEDFSISRSQKRAKNWGVPVPNDPTGEVMYVWFDALSNYITALDYDSNGEHFKKYWPADVHVIGKGVIRFHAVYWPAMLLSAGLQLPRELFVHGYINVDGTKMSKSLGNVVDPFATVSKYGVDVVRYYLLRYLSPYEDSSFSEEHLREVYVSDLSNGLGNVVSRVTGLIEQNQTSIKIKAMKSLPKEYCALFETFNFNDVLKLVWHRITTVDELISRTKPWELAKAGKAKELNKILNEASQTIYEFGRMLKPFMPETADRIEKIITTTTIKKSEPLFPRLS
jgi:methionyl-tRNA synthetase